MTNCMARNSHTKRRETGIDLNTHTRFTHDPTTNTVLLYAFCLTYSVILEVGGGKTLFSRVDQGALVVVDACVVIEEHHVVIEEHHVVYHVSGSCATGFPPKVGGRKRGRKGGGRKGEREEWREKMREGGRQ